MTSQNKMILERIVEMRIILSASASDSTEDFVTETSENIFEALDTIIDTTRNSRDNNNSEIQFSQPLLQILDDLHLILIRTDRNTGKGGVLETSKRIMKNKEIFQKLSKNLSIEARVWKTITLSPASSLSPLSSLPKYEEHHTEGKQEEGEVDVHGIIESLKEQMENQMLLLEQNEMRKMSTRKEFASSQLHLKNLHAICESNVVLVYKCDDLSLAIESKDLKLVKDTLQEMRSMAVDHPERFQSKSGHRSCVDELDRLSKSLREWIGMTEKSTEVIKSIHDELDSTMSEDVEKIASCRRSGASTGDEVERAFKEYHERPTLVNAQNLMDSLEKLE